MIQHLIILFWLLFALKSVQSHDITVREGQDAIIKCDFVLAHDNVKYFCRDPCTEPQHILIKSDQPSHSHPKYLLADKGSGVFTVTISKVKSTDSGIYYCGVNRLLKDTFAKVTVKVIADNATTHSILPSSLSPSAAESTWPVDGTDDTDDEDEAFLYPEHTLAAAPLPPRTPVEKEEDGTVADTKLQPRSRHMPEQAERQPSGRNDVIYIGAGLAMLILVMVLSLFILYTRKIRKDLALPAGQNLTTSSGNVQKLSLEHIASPSTQVQCIYAEVTICHDNPGLVAASCHTTHSTESSAIYSNVFLPSNKNPDSDYSTIRFDQDEESLQYATVRFTDPPAGGDKLESSPGSDIYSTIKI